MTNPLRFDSVSAALRFGASPLPAYTTEQSSRRRGDSEWAGTSSYTEAEKLALAWADGVAKMARIRVAATVGTRQRVVYRRSVTGPGSVVMPDVIRGVPDPYRRRTVVAREIHGKGKIVRILLNNAASSGVSADTYLSRGGAVLALCDALERAGRRVEIVVAFGISMNGAGKPADRSIFTTVKKASDKANLASIAFAIAHPAWLRRIGFAIFERLDQEFVKDCVNGGGYGYPGKVPTDGFDIALGEAAYGDPNFSSPDRAQAWVTEKLSEFGVKVTGQV